MACYVARRPRRRTGAAHSGRPSLEVVGPADPVVPHRPRPSFGRCPSSLLWLATALTCWFDGASRRCKNRREVAPPGPWSEAT